MAIPSSSSNLLDDPASLVESEPGSCDTPPEPCSSGALEFSDACIDTRRRSGAAVAPDSPILFLGAARPHPGASDAPNAASLKNPVAATPAVARRRQEGLRRELRRAATVHRAEGSVKAGVIISIIQEQGGKQPPDLTDAQWDHGSTDGEIYTAIRKGVPPTMMAGWEGRISDTEIWQHRQLPARARGEPRHGRTDHRRAHGGRARRTQAGAAARRLRAAADHG